LFLIAVAFRQRIFVLNKKGFSPTIGKLIFLFALAKADLENV
jgi:hypothetical protein